MLILNDLTMQDLLAIQFVQQQQTNKMLSPLRCPNYLYFQYDKQKENVIFQRSPCISLEIIKFKGSPYCSLGVDFKIKKD